MNTGVRCHFLPQDTFLTQRLKAGSLASPALAGGFFTTNLGCSTFYLLQLDGQPKPEAKARCDARAHRKGDYPFPQPTFFTSRKPCITLLTQTVWAAASPPSLCTDTVVEKDTGPYILAKFHFTVLDPLPFFYCRVLLLVQFSSVAQSCPTLCDPMNRSTPGFPVHHQLPEFTQTHDYRVSNTIQPSHPLLSPSPPAPKSF